MSCSDNWPLGFVVARVWLVRPTRRNPGKLFTHGVHVATRAAKMPSFSPL